MLSNNNLQKLIAIFGVAFLVACASKAPVGDVDTLLDAQRLQEQKEQAQFQHALGLVQTKNATKDDLLEAKTLLDALYQSNTAYLGALINSADISLKLERLEEAKALYLEVIQRVENTQEKVNPGIAVSEHNTMFSVHTYNQLGLIERQQGKFDQAEVYYREALALEPNNLATIKNLAILLDLYRGKLVEALDLYEQYQNIVGDEDPKVKDWIYDLKNRVPAEEVDNE
jgi:tetratricopeptide (TPR) repeat protein